MIVSRMRRIFFIWCWKIASNRKAKEKERKIIASHTGWRHEKRSECRRQVFPVIREIVKLKFLLWLVVFILHPFLQFHAKFFIWRMFKEGKNPQLLMVINLGNEWNRTAVVTQQKGTFSLPYHDFHVRKTFFCSLFSIYHHTSKFLTHKKRHFGASNSLSLFFKFFMKQM